MDLQPHEVLLKLVVPFTRPNEYVKEFKQVRAPHAGRTTCVKAVAGHVAYPTGAWQFQKEP